ncbi:MAG: TIGR01212 family radical SAM protein [Ruminococcaceae bacterium]|nr:TIGR01212 family radical SAM protein [Oscillospiraceae bacterium]
MMATQKERNPFPNSDSNKRYYTYDYYLRKTFGGKCAKIPLDVGFTCPNIDGRCGVGGCIYCSGRGSGDFAASPTLSIREQVVRAAAVLGQKWRTERLIPYFQAHTNTYAPLSVLREKYEEALALDGVVALNIATRADCLADDVVSYLAEIAERTVLTVELGLQSVHDETADKINRGHSFAQFLEGYEKLRRASDRIKIGIHLIFGLPGEDDDMMLESVRRVAKLRPDFVKLHLLHVLRSSRLAALYERGEYTPLERDRYISLVVQALELLPPDTVIERLTGDGMGDDLLAPDWSRKKVSVINDIDKRMYATETYQGKNYI